MKVEKDRRDKRIGTRYFSKRQDNSKQKSKRTRSRKKEAMIDNKSKVAR